MGSSSTEGNVQTKGFDSQVQGSGSGSTGKDVTQIGNNGKPPKDYKIRDIYKPTPEQRETLAFVYKERYYAMRDAPERSKYMKLVDKWERQWEGFRVEKGEDQWQSNHVVPITISVVETALSELVRQNMRPFLKARGPSDQPKITLMSHIWDYAWDVSDSDLMMYDVLKDLLINGLAITQEYYKQDVVLVQVPHQKDRKSPVTYTKEKKIDYDDVFGEIVKIQDFFPDELGRRFDGPYKLRDCVRRYIMNIEDFKVMYVDSKWDQFGNAQFVKPGGDINYYEWYTPPEGIDTSRQVEVLHYWSERPYDRWVIVANDVLIRDGENPYNHKKLPFARAVDIKRVHHFYAKGEPELLESIQSEANILRRMVIDRNHLDIDKMFFVSNKLGLNDEDTMARPHGVIPVDDIDSAKAIEYGDIPRSVELSMTHLEDDATISTGINPRAQALPQTSTATEAAILKESTLRRIETKLWLLRKEYLVRIGRLRLSNILQFYSEPTLEKIVGEEGMAEYEARITDLKQRELLYEDPETSDKYEKVYRNIPIKKKKLSFSDDGSLTQSPSTVDTYFHLKDKKYFMPVERGGYDTRFDGGPNIDISKPLKQQKNLEMFDRFSQIAIQVPNTYDIVKLGDIILRDNDINPDDVKPDQVVAQETQATRVQMLQNLAMFENKMMMRGDDVPATPYASAAHTMVHVQFMHSPEFQNLDNKKDKEIIEMFTKHVMGEIMAQEARNQNGLGAPQDASQLPAGPGMTAPGQQLNLPSQQPPSLPQTNQGGISNGVMNRPGGMAQAKMNMSDVMPGRS